jgi:predicted phosphodiesterase
VKQSAIDSALVVHFDGPLASIAQSGVEHALVKSGVPIESCHQHDVMLATNKLVQGTPGALRSRFRTPHKSEFPSGQWDVLRLYYAIIRARFNGNMARYKELKERLKFSIGDIDWGEALIEYLEIFDSADGHEIPYVRWKNINDSMIEDFDLPIKIALIGDWGTGTEFAEQILKQAVHLKPDIIIHLGDVYYAGTKTQYQSKVIDLIEKHCKGIPILNMPGNHDMYSGGNPYYDAFKVLNKKAKPFKDNIKIEQTHSFFGLRDKKKRWQILAMDTAYFDHDPFTVESDLTKVHPSEEEWLMHHTAVMSATKGKTILLSHHQPFSCEEGIGDPMQKNPEDFYVNPHLMSLHRKLALRGDLAAWFWGHEHRWQVYEKYRSIKNGRCIGHGAIPVFVNDSSYANYRPGWTVLAEGFYSLLTGSASLNRLRNFTALFWRVISGSYEGIPKRVLVDDKNIEPDPGPMGVTYRNGFAILTIDEDANAKVNYYEAGNESSLHCEEL